MAQPCDQVFCPSIEYCRSRWEVKMRKFEDFSFFFLFLHLEQLWFPAKRSERSLSRFSQWCNWNRNKSVELNCLMGFCVYSRKSWWSTQTRTLTATVNLTWACERLPRTFEGFWEGSNTHYHSQLTWSIVRAVDFIRIFTSNGTSQPNDCVTMCQDWKRKQFFAQ